MKYKAELNYHYYNSKSTLLLVLLVTSAIGFFTFIATKSELWWVPLSFTILFLVLLLLYEREEGKARKDLHKKLK
jgi:hypothetical protein